MIIPDNFRSILIIQLGPYGDVLLNTSYFSALRKKYPTTKIDFLVSKPYDSILYNNPYLSEILTIPKAKGIMYILQRIKTFIRIACRHYELVIDQQCGTGTCLLYTSDAADDLLCVDLGGRRIIKKKN